MKYTDHKHFTYLASFVFLIFLPCGAKAASASWNINNNGNWNSTGSWDANGIPGDTASTTNTDIATFDFTLSTSRSVTVDTDRNIGGITFGNTSGFQYTLTGGNLLFTDGAVIQSTSTNGDHADRIASAMEIEGDGGSVTFTGGASSANSYLNITGTISGVSTGSNVTTINLNGTNTGANILSGSITDGAGGGGVAVVKTGSGSWTLNNSGSTFTGGVSVKEGTLNINNGASLGGSTVTLGDTSGGNDASLVTIGNNMTYTNAIVLASGTTGTLTIGRTAGNNTNALSGGITGDNNLTIDTGNSNGGFNFTTNAINIGGTITYESTGTGASQFLVNVGSAVTGITQNSGTSQLTVGSNSSNTLTVNSGGTTLANNGGRLLRVNSSINGTGDLILQNNSPLSSGITLYAGANNTGDIINSGTGTNASATAGTVVLYLDRNVYIAGGTSTTTPAAAIGSNVVNVIQDSPTSVMELYGINSYTGDTLVKQGTLIIGSATAAGTSQILVGDTSGSSDASLLLRGSGTTITNNILVQAGGSGTATVGQAGSSNGGRSTFSGDVTLDKSATLSSFGNATYFSGLISGTGGITVVDAGTGVSTSGQTYGITGGYVNLLKNDLTNTYQGDTKVLSGTLQLETSVANQDVTGLLGTSTNAVVIGDTTGYQTARLILNPKTTSTFTRDFLIQAGNGGLSTVGETGSNAATFTGNFSLDKSLYLVGGASGTPLTIFSGAITKGSGAIDATSLTSSGGGILELTNTANNFDGGIVVGGAGTVWGSGTGTLGTGNVVVEIGAVRLSDQTALASGKTVHTGPYGAISIGTNSSAQIAYVAGVLDSSSVGGVTLGANVGNTIDLSLFGNGLMFLGSDGGNSNYSASTLGTNSDGNYRLGYGNSLLTVTTSALDDASAKLIVGSPDHTGQGTGIANTSGSVTLQGANAYGGGTEVNIGSSLKGKQQASSGSPFGDSAGAMTLHGSTLFLENTAGNATSSSTVGTTVGAFAFDGSSSVQIQGVTAGGGNNTLTVGEITRNDKGVLSVTAYTAGTLGTDAFFKTTGTAPTTTSVKGLGNTTAAMAPVYFIDNSSGNFLTYDGTNGFGQLSAYTTVTSAVAGGNTGVTRLTANEALSTTGDRTLAALGIYASGSSVSLTNSSGSDLTLTLTSGGLNYVGNNQSATIGSGTTNQGINLDFNGQEAVINATGSGNSGLAIRGAISNATGITKSGTAPLTLYSNNSTFVGDITVIGGSLVISNDLNLGGSGASLNNGLVLNGGRLIVDSGGITTLSGTRTITLGTYGGTLSSRSSGNISANTVVVDSKITGTSNYLDIQSGMAGSNQNNVTSVYTLTNTANDFVAPIFIGSAGGAGNSGRMALTFDTDSQLGDVSNSVTLIGGNSVLRYTGSGALTTARAINFMELGGSLEVSDAGGTLTASGTLAGSGLFNKLGSGRLNLTGASTYTANTNVTAGVLNVSNDYALGATTAAISGASGVSGGGVYVQDGAALELQGDIALAGTGGKTLYLNGDGISNGGSLRNISGDNSNTGPVILQSNTTIGADSGSLTLSGVVGGSGTSLTKVGSGTLVLSGDNTYSGGTTVSAGKLLVNNSTGSGTGTGALSIGASAILGGSGTIGGPTTISGTLAPGNSPGILTFSDAVTLESGSFTTIEINGVTTRGTDYDGVNFNGGLTVNGGTLTFNISTAIDDGTTLDLFDGSAFTSSLTSVVATGSGGYSGSFVYNGVSSYIGTFGSQLVTFTLSTGDLSFAAAPAPVPEPATAAALLAASALALASLRRGRRSPLA